MTISKPTVAKQPAKVAVLPDQLSVLQDLNTWTCQERYSFLIPIFDREILFACVSPISIVFWFTHLFNSNILTPLTLFHMPHLEYDIIQVYLTYLPINYLYLGHYLTLPMLRLLSSKAQGCKDFQKPSKHCHVGIHWIALAEYSQMSTHVPRFQSFFQVFCIFLYWSN